MSLRVIQSADQTEMTGGLGTAAQRPSDLPGADNYLSRLVKFVPVEVTTAYPLIVSAAPSELSWARPLGECLLLLISVMIRLIATQDKSGNPQVITILITSLSFILYVLAWGGDFGFFAFTGIDIHDTKPGDGGVANAAITTYLSTLALVGWTLLAPYIYKGEQA